MTNTPTKLIAFLAAALLLAACSGGDNRVHYYDTSLIIPGQAVSVKQGDTVYTLARENKVAMRDIIALNQLQPPYRLLPGQMLTMPAGKSGSGALAVQSVPVGQVTYEPLAPAGAPMAYNNTAYNNAPVTTYTGTPQYNVVDNSIGGGNATWMPPSQPIQPPTQLKSGIGAQELPPPNALQTVAQQAQQQLAQAATNMRAAIAGAPKFIWPVKGPVLSGFGPKGQGLNNDGLNIGAPRSAPVAAAASGTVVYAGNEMKGFGNLVLIRHEGGWITAYAHLERMLVERDSVVGQGDMIGTVGTSGGVASPQLHFEVRQNGKPIDPAPYLPVAG
jgi:murein DD-endopeptidase MepM/ murein hydrolase activator NlpD